ncbi:MAG: hypothetical protein AAF517_25920, partial [Planctomycetota bacterium]
MAKRKKLDEFLEAKKQSQESALEEKTQLSNRFFRYSVGGVVILLLLGLLDVPRGSVVGLTLLFTMVASLGTFALGRLHPKLFPGAASFNQFVFLLLATVLTYWCALALDFSPYLTPLPFMGMVLGMAYSQVGGVLIIVALSFYMAMLGHESGPNIDFPRAIVFCFGGVTSVLGVVL